MKYLFFFLFILCLACKINQNTNTTTTSPTQWLYFAGKNNNAKKIVLISGDEEYRSEEALPMLAKILSKHHGFECTVLFAQDPTRLGVANPNYVNHISGIEQLADADLMILFTRFRDLPDAQMQQFEDYLMAGKPLIGIRTATHAFHIRDTTSKWAHWGNYFKDETSAWNDGFGRLVLGERWHTHHGHHKHQSTRGVAAAGATNHPVLNGIANAQIWGSTDVYGVRLPLPDDAQHIVMGQVINRAGEYDENDLLYGMHATDSEIARVNPATKVAYNPNDPMMPIVWTKSYQLPKGKQGKSLTSTIGASTDMLNDGVRRLFVNASYYMLGMEVPKQVLIDYVGEYQPTPYQFHDDAYWEKQNMVIGELR